MVSSIKRQKVAAAIKRTLGEILIREQFTKISITDVQVSNRLETAKIYYNLLDPLEQQNTQKILTQKQPYLRHLIAISLNLRLTPLLLFQYDQTEERANKIQQLINQVT